MKDRTRVYDSRGEYVEGVTPFDAEAEVIGGMDAAERAHRRFNPGAEVEAIDWVVAEVQKIQNRAEYRARIWQARAEAARMIQLRTVGVSQNP